MDKMKSEDMGNMMEDQETAPEVSEDYIADAQKALADVYPEDFEPIKGRLSVDGNDGDTVALLVTGTIQNGRLVDPMGTQLTLGDQESGAEDEQESGGKLKKIFRGNAEEEA
jgi:hypothetical protein